MKPELEQQLKDKYPGLYNDTLWGFECGDGWYKLIDELSSCIVSYKQDVIADQVKEKFGQLRFYTNYSDRYIDGMITLAEHMSARICEQCGSEGKMRGGGWIVTLCDKHAKELDDES